ncbi:MULTISPECIES: ABC transporter permease [unclassified Sphingomonas]|jgi:ABC-2 type transport system permease protein|uniref:ABC transporter permease n=2 Tax=Pseudomonadota TaxID=1224 RepID=UPI000E0FFFFC|nr:MULTISPECIES: ABC transporter permease [unclassified Sphingomonas]AXJ96502.1 ABC transporter permease [Sphingomonas sp. FARSPH]
MTALVAPPTGVWLREAVAELKRTSRLPQFLVPTVLTPAAFYGLFTLAVAKSPSPEYALGTLAGYGVFAATGPALFGFGAGVAMEREQGLIELKRVSPMPAGAYVAAKLVAAVATTALALVLIDALAIVAGVRLSAATWIALTLLHLGSAIPFALIGFGMGMRMSGKGAVAMANALFLGGSVLGGLWIPTLMLPGWMRTLGQVTPSYHLGQLARGIVGVDTLGSPFAHAMAVAAMTAAGVAWAWSGWRRSPA